MDLTAISLSEASRLIDGRQLSPLELARAYLERIQQLNPALNPFITVTGEWALEQARAAEQAIQRGDNHGPLYGIPIALKDLYDTKGVRTTAGAKFLVDNVPDANCAVAEKLNAAGTILLGKLNMHEWALGVTNANPHYGSCRNPWNTACIPGGSSGGSAAALAARLCLGSFGSDTGGSIRIPAALCGVVGLKPTYGRVSVRGIVPLSPNLDHAGPMAQCVRDAALLLSAVAGYDPADPYSAGVHSDDYLGALDAGVHGWRVGCAFRGYFADCEPDVLEAVRRASTVFEQMGARVDEVEVWQPQETRRASGVMTVSDAAAFHGERIRQRPQDFGDDVLSRLKSGLAFTATDYALARQTQVQARHHMQSLFENYDLLLTPTTPAAAAPIDGLDGVEMARILTRFTAQFNLTGHPALSVPCGFSRGGLPIGLQIIGALWAEAKVLRGAYAYEQATDWHLKHPSL